MNVSNCKHCGCSYDCRFWEKAKCSSGNGHAFQIREKDFTTYREKMISIGVIEIDAFMERFQKTHQ